MSTNVYLPTTYTYNSILIILQVKIAKAIADSMNFKFTIHPPADGAKWGEEVEPGVFSGIVGELQKETADVIWADLFIIPNRMKIIDYTQPYTIDYVCYMVGEYCNHLAIYTTPWGISVLN